MDRDDRRLAAIYRVHGDDAVYSIDGRTTPCRVTRHQPPADAAKTAAMDFPGLSVADHPVKFLVRRSELPERPTQGGVFTVGEITFTVGEAATPYGRSQAEWLCCVDAGEEA